MSTKAAGRVRWLDYIAQCVHKRQNKMTAGDLVLAHAFTSGNFDYSSGRQTRYVSHSFLAEKAGMTKSSATRFFRKARAAGCLSEMAGARRTLVEGKRATPMYQLTVPDDGHEPGPWVADPQDEPPW